jgi:hypothetical protein
MPPSKSKLQAVVEESTQNAPSVTTAVKSIANILLGPRGQTPIDSILQMQHYQLWGFILIVAGLLYIVWLMQKKLDNIDKQYKEQFVLLHRLFKSHQDLQVEVRRKPNVPTTAVEANHAPQTTTSLELEEEDELVFDEHQVMHTSEQESVSERTPEEQESVSEQTAEEQESVSEETAEEQESVSERTAEEEEDYEVFE